MAGKKIRIKAFLMIFIITTAFITKQGNVQAAEEQFLLSLDSQELQMGVSANLIVSVVNANNVEIKEIKGLENFDVLSTSQSQTTQIINGASSYQNDITYTIMPKTEGEFTLQATINYNGTSYQTNELQVTVSQAVNQADPGNGEASELFLKTILSDNEIYFGQKVALSYELYTRYNLENYGFLDDVNIDGFVANEVAQDKLGSNYVTIGNNKYARYELKQMYLSPIKTGNYTISSYNFQANASTGGFFGSVKPFYLQSEAEDITVKPLPQEGQPADFSGIVGKLNIQATYDKQAVGYGDSLTLNITASGNCNLDNLRKVIKDGIPGFSVYETEKSSEEGIQEDQYYAKKEFNVILVPENTGDIKIDPIKISYFNPETGSYENAEIPGTTITVSGEIPQTNTQQGQAPSYKTVEISQVSYGTSQDDGFLTIKLSKSFLYIGMAVIILLLIIATIVIIFLKNSKKQDKALAAIYKQLQKSSDQNEIYNSFNNMMKHYFNINLKASSRDIVINRLNEYGEIESELTVPILDIMDQMERITSDNGILNLKNKIKEIYKKLIKMKK